MRFSIITPCFNCKEYIEKCILSLKNQTFGDFEHIIIDGGSTDGTLDIIRKYEGTYPMRWISEKDNGMYDAINKGFDMAQGEIFSWINADDNYMPWTLFAVNKIFLENKDVHWVTGIPSNMDSNGCMYFRSGYKVNTYNRKCIAAGQHHGRGKGFIQQESTFWTKSLWERAGGLNANYKFAGDFDLWVRFARLEQLYTINMVLASFRIHTEQKSADTQSYFREIKEYCTWLNFIWWAFDKIFKIKKIYNKKNSKYILECIEKESINTRTNDIKEYISTFLLRK